MIVCRRSVFVSDRGERWGRRRRLSAVALVAGLASLAACTAQEADPPPPPEEDAAGDEVEEQVSAAADIAVILPPRDALDEELADAISQRLESMEPETDTEISGVRTVFPETPAFVEDLVGQFADRGTQVVCVLGPRAPLIASRAAQIHRGTRFCAASTPPRSDDSVLRLELRAAELGHVAGIAARRRAGAGPVGVLLGGVELPDDTFSAGLQTGLEGIDVVTPADPSASFTDQVDDVMRSEPSVVVVDGAPGSHQIAELVERDVLLVGPTAVLADADAERRLVTWEVRWEVVLQGALTSLVGEGVGPVSFGGTEGVFDLTYGDAASDGVRGDIQRAFEGFATGDRDPLDRDPGEMLPPPADDEENADDG